MSNTTNNPNKLLAQLIKQHEAEAKPLRNPHWSMKDGQIWDNTLDQPFSIEPFNALLDVVTAYFRSVWELCHSEAQVLIMTDTEIEQLDVSWIPQIPSPIKNIHILVLPQNNSWGNTTISETWWQTNIASKQLSPLMRIHSHHTLEAYQSITDWSTLNSNTLELVIGKVTSKQRAIGYWLDILGTDNKDTVFYTDDNGKTVYPGRNGRPSTTVSKN